MSAEKLIRENFSLNRSQRSLVLLIPFWLRLLQEDILARDRLELGPAKLIYEVLHTVMRAFLFNLFNFCLPKSIHVWIICSVHIPNLFSPFLFTVPSVPLNVRAVWVGNDSVRLRWTRPLRPNGVIVGYRWVPNARNRRGPGNIGSGSIKKFYPWGDIFYVSHV